MKKILSIILALSILSASYIPGFALSNITSENLALNKPVTTNDQLSSYPAKNAVDGDIKKGWSPNGNNFPEITVDLGKPYKITGIEFVTRQDLDQANSREVVEIRGSNDPDCKNYELLAAHTKASEPIPFQGTWSADINSPNGYRYIQLTTGGMYYVFVGEFRVYGEEFDENAVDDSLPVYSDVNENLEMMDMLSALNIVKPYSDNSFEPDRELTRAEACEMVARLLRIENLDSDQAAFEDVPFEYWGNKYISLLHEQGIVSGIGNNKFGPEENIDSAAFLKMVLCGLGYGQMANEDGGYPNGYIKLGYKHKLIDDSFNGDTPILRKDAAKIVYNALQIPALTLKSVESGGTNYTMNRNNTVLNEYFDVYEKTGYVTGVEETNITDGSKLDEGKIEIDNIIHDTITRDNFDLLGTEVTYYEKRDEETGKDKILQILPNKSRRLRVYSDDILPTDSRLTFNYIDSKDKEKTVSLAHGAVFLYNKSLFKGAEAKDMCPTNGYVDLIDSDSDGEYELVSVINYEPYIINTVSESNGIITLFDVRGKKVQLDTTDSSKKTCLYNADGVEISYMAIEKFDLAYVAKSKDESVIYVYLNDEKVSGVVTRLINDGSKAQEIRVGDANYVIADGYHDFVKAYYDVDEIKVGDAVTLCIDIYGKVAAHLNSSGSEISKNKFGYLINASTPTGAFEKAQIMIYTYQGTMQVFDCSDKFKLNGDEIENHKEISVNLSNSATNNTYGQPIVYRENSKGEVVSVLTNGNSLSDDTRLEMSNIKIEYFYLSSVKAFFNVNGKIADFYISDNTKIIIVPEYTSGLESIWNNETYYSYGDYSILYNWEHYYAEAYNSDENTEVDLVVVYQKNILGSDAAKQKYTSPTWVVDKVTENVDANGELYYELHYYEGEDKKSYACSPLFDLSETEFTKADGTVGHYMPQRGDVIRCAISNSKIIGAVLMFRAAEPTTAKPTCVWDTKSYSPHYYRTSLGYIKRVSDRFMTFGIYNPEADDIDSLKTEMYVYTGATTYIYDKADDSLTIAPASEVLNHQNLRNYPVFAVSKIGESVTYVVVK